MGKHGITKKYDRKKVIRALADLGFFEHHGNGTSHTIFMCRDGVRCQSKICKREVSLQGIAMLGMELEKKTCYW